MQFESQYWAMVKHFYYLNASLNLVFDREQQLLSTLAGQKLKEVPTDENGFTTFLKQVSQELGGVRTRMLFDAPREVMLYHFGPIQISLCLLYAVLEAYKRLIDIDPVFRFNEMDDFCRENDQFVSQLKELRNSVLHPRHEKACDQLRFLSAFSGEDGEHFAILLKEGAKIYKDYLLKLWSSFKKDKDGE